MARKANIITAVDLSTDRVSYRRPEDAPNYVRTDRWSYLTKNDKGATLKFLGYHFNKPYVHCSLDELDSYYFAIKAKFEDGSPSPAPAPKVPTPTPTPKEEPMPYGNDNDGDDAVQTALKQLLEVVMSTSAKSVDLEQVKSVVAEALSPHTDTMTALTNAVAELQARQPKVVEVHIPNREPKKLDGIQHFQFAKVLAHIGVGNHLLMVGPAGTGKSTIAEQAAQALGLDFSSKSVTAQTSEASLLGFMNANGNYIATEFRRRFEHGGVFLLDEVDAGNPNVLGVLNSALANDWVAFPDQMVSRHKDFVAIACGNTYGNGATAEYVGRNPLDKAFVDRFTIMDIMIDEAIEDAMVMATGLDATTATNWLTFVRKVRKNIQSHGLKIVVSPRGSLAGAKALTTGQFTRSEVTRMCILKGANPEQEAKMLEGASF